MFELTSRSDSVEFSIHIKYNHYSHKNNDATQFKNFLVLKLPPSFPHCVGGGRKAAISKLRSFSTDLCRSYLEYSKYQIEIGMRPFNLVDCPHFKLKFILKSADRPVSTRLIENLLLGKKKSFDLS